MIDQMAIDDFPTAEQFQQLPNSGVSGFGRGGVTPSPIQNAGSPVPGAPSMMPLINGTKTPDGGFSIPGVGTVGPDGRFTPDPTAQHLFDGRGPSIPMPKMPSGMTTLASLGSGALGGMFGGGQSNSNAGGVMTGLQRAMTRMRTPSGRILNVPAEHIQEALARGAQHV